jgi:Domain of unknown function (DUF397).
VDLIEPLWRKSSRSGPDSPQCVEVATNIPGVIAIRDSKNPNGDILLFPAAEWRTFVQNIKAGAR